jgi:hypothetical protein
MFMKVKCLDYRVVVVKFSVFFTVEGLVYEGT